MCNELGANCYVQASDEERSLYEKFGFEVLGEVGFDLGEYGFEGRARMTEMNRVPDEK
jgi:hypothetical protein